MLRVFSGLKPVRLGPLGLVRPELLALGALVLAIIVAGVGIAIAMLSGPPAPSPRLVASNLQSVHLDEPIKVRFSRPADVSKTSVSVTPHVAFKVERGSSSLVLQPSPSWGSDTTYTVRLGDVPDSKHNTVLHGYSGTFHTQQVVGVAAFTVNGQPAAGQVASSVDPNLTAVFSTPMKTETVHFLLNGKALAAGAVSWDKDGTHAAITLPDLLLPYRVSTLQVPKNGFARNGDPMTSAAQLSMQALGIEPSNSSSGIGPGFKLVAPVMVVIENAPAARPQYGLQNADMVFEYISEYGITRMTALFFNQVSPLLRSVRSCRVINLYLDFGMNGLHMCSGTSAGTYLWFMGNHGTPVAPGVINDVDTHGYFFRCGADNAPHNLCVSGANAERLRSNWKLPAPTYMVDPPHADIGAQVPAGPPSVGQHCVSYTYDAAQKTYLRYDHGTPSVDGQTGRQIQVKNVVVMTVNEHFAGWVEDENGGAGSVWYEMLGSGPADIYTDGGVIHGAWHFGDSPAIPEMAYYANHQAIYFTDSNGNLVRLNTGLTWIHVLGRQGLNAGC